MKVVIYRSVVNVVLEGLNMLQELVIDTLGVDLLVTSFIQV